MKRNLLIASLVLLILSVSAWTQVSKPRWEYKAIGSPKDLDKLGEEGWELSAIDSDGHVFYLKRQK